MATYTAAIATQADVTDGDYCDVCVLIDDYDSGPEPTLGVVAALASVPIGVRVDDEDRLAKVEQAAIDVLTQRGWKVTSDWDYGDNALYADAVPDYDNPLYEA